MLTLTESAFGQRLKGPGMEAGDQQWVREGLAHAERAVVLYHQAGDPDEVLMALAALVDYHSLRGDVELASRYSDQAVELSRRVSSTDMLVVTQALLGYAHQARRELPEAISCFRAAVSMLPGDTPAWARQRAEYLAEIAETYQSLGDARSAREAWTTALDLLNHVGHPMAAQIRAQLSALADPPPG